MGIKARKRSSFGVVSNTGSFHYLFLRFHRLPRVLFMRGRIIMWIEQRKAKHFSKIDSLSVTFDLPHLLCSVPVLPASGIMS